MRAAMSTGTERSACMSNFFIIICFDKFNIRSKTIIGNNYN